MLLIYKNIDSDEFSVRNVGRIKYISVQCYNISIVT